jgi:hypothetical protein
MKNLETAIKSIIEEHEVWDILIKESKPQAGPFDGGCLICADSIIEAAGSDEGLLVKILNLETGNTEHYGAYVDGEIYDFNGSFENVNDWMEAFRKETVHLKDTLLDVSFGLDQLSEIERDTDASKKIAVLIYNELKELGERNTVSFRADTEYGWELMEQSLRNEKIEIDVIENKNNGKVFEILLKGGRTINDVFEAIINLSDSHVILDTIRPCSLELNSLDRRYNGRYVPENWMQFSENYAGGHSKFREILWDLEDTLGSTSDIGSLLGKLNLELLDAVPSKDDKHTLEFIHNLLAASSTYCLYEGRPVNESKMLTPLKQAIASFEKNNIATPEFT